MKEPLVFETKDEDYLGFKPLGSTDDNFRLLDLLNKIKDFDSRIMELDLRDKDRYAGSILVEYAAISKERDKALQIKAEEDHKMVQATITKLTTSSKLIMRFKQLHLVEKNVDDENIEFETFLDPYLRFLLKDEVFKVDKTHSS